MILHLVINEVSEIIVTFDTLVNGSEENNGTILSYMEILSKIYLTFALAIFRVFESFLRVLPRGSLSPQFLILKLLASMRINQFNTQFIEHLFWSVESFEHLRLSIFIESHDKEFTIGFCVFILRRNLKY